MARTITTVNRKDIYGISSQTIYTELELSNFLLNVDRIAMSDAIWFEDNGDLKRLK